MDVTCKYADWTRGQISSLINILGEKNARNILAGVVSVKLNPSLKIIGIEKSDQKSDWNEGQVEALLNSIGEENARNILAGASFEIKNFQRTLFDKNGRKIPSNFEFSVCDAGNPIKLSGNTRSYQDLIYGFPWEIRETLDNKGFDFESKTERLLKLISDNPQVSNILKGAWVPIIIPKLLWTIEGCFKEYLYRAKCSYADFYNNHGAYHENKNSFCGKFYTDPRSRYDELIRKIRYDYCVGIYFLNPLQGYSVLAAREQMETLPKGLVLSGFESLIAEIMYPHLISEQDTFLDFGAFSWVLNPSDPKYTSYALRTKDAGLTFGTTMSLNYSNSNYSSGLTFIG